MSQFSTVLQRHGAEDLDIVVLVNNLNDNHPLFIPSLYTFTAKELSPVDTSVGFVEAQDADKEVLFYLVEPENAYFKIKTETNPTIVVKSAIDYDVVQKVTFKLVVRDTTDLSPPDGPSHSATATITINIEDVDNRPPWFQPCTPLTVGSAKICLSTGYSGKVNLTELTGGVLPLEPGPLYAIDGDEGRKDQIIYRFVAGDGNGIFNIDENSGNITMLKAADMAGPIVLTVLHAPIFEKQQYEGFIPSDSSVDSMVLEDKASNRPLRVLATDADFADGVNPLVRYEVVNSGDFTLTAAGFILLKRELSPGTFSLQIKAIDTSNRESSTAALSVQVLPEPTTAMSTTVMSPESTPLTASTTPPLSSSLPMTTQEEPSTSFHTANTPTTEEAFRLLGQYRDVDMAALGASLGGVVVLCLAVITLLVFRIKRGDAAWKKLSEASIFRSTMAQGSGGVKEGMQYTNNAFQKEDDTSSMSSNILPSKVELALGATAAGLAQDGSLESQAVLGSATRLETLLTDADSLAGSEQADSEKEVKPILTKERRNEDGYKSVWFKEDIDPNAKEEVVIIPDSGERDVEEDEEEGEVESLEGGSREEEDEEDRRTSPEPQNNDKNRASDSDGEDF
ncbi:hypothetical protein JZ751_008137, partial [Albula glossodonta]